MCSLKKTAAWRSKSLDALSSRQRLDHGPARIEVPNKESITMLTDLKANLAKLQEDATAIRAAAESQSRPLTTEEKTSIKAKLSQYDSLSEDIALREKMDSNNAALSTPEPRKTVITGGNLVAASQANHGFRDVSDFLKSVRNARYGSVDPRLAQNAVGTYGNETTNADGAYALPPDFRAGINTMVNGVDSLVSRLDQIFTPNLTITMPMDEDQPWTAAGIQIGSVGEGVAYTQTKPVLKTWTATLAKYGGLISVSEEALEDGTLLGPYVQRKAASKLNYALNAAVITAIGAAGNKIAVAKQAAEGVGTAPVLATYLKMWSQLHVTFRQNAIWLMNPIYEGSLFALNGTTALNFPYYIPAGVLGNPNATLFGRPVVFAEGLAAIGVAGSVFLVDPSAFYGVLKSTGVKADVTPYFAFDQDLVSYKISVRAAFKSKWASVITRPDSTTASSVLSITTF